MDDTNTIQLQSIGHVAAEPADTVTPGDYLLWNYGSYSRVLGIVKETKCFVTFKTVTEDGRTWQRRLKRSRLVARRVVGRDRIYV